MGAKLLPAMTKLAEAGLKMVDWVDKNQTAVGVLAGAIAGLVTAVWAISAAAKAYTALAVSLDRGAGMQEAAVNRELRATLDDLARMKVGDDDDAGE